MSRANRLVRPVLIGLGVAAGIVLLTATPFAAHAQGIVQCKPFSDTSKLVTCDLCELYKMVNTIISIAAGGLVGFGVLALIIGGIRYITAAGSPGLVEKAKKTVQFAITGIIIVTLAFVIIQVVFTAITGKQGGNIFSGISCTLPTVPSTGGGGETPPPPATPGPPTNPPPGGEDCQGTIGGCKDSPALQQFMSCFESQLSGLVDLGKSNAHGNGHAKNSCHYGGTSCTDGSHAVDYAGKGGAPSFNASDAALINSATKICGSKVGGAAARGEYTIINPTTHKPETVFTTPDDPKATHIHINVANQSCGCN